MKFRVGDKVLVTAGKDKGKTAKVVRVLPKINKVLVEGVNQFVKHLKPTADRAGQRILKERPLPLANIAILNDKGQPDRVGYKIAKDGTKERIFKKTGQVITASAQKDAAPAKKEVKKEAAAAKVEKTEKAAKPKKATASKVSKK